MMKHLDAKRWRRVLANLLVLCLMMGTILPAQSGIQAAAAETPYVVSTDRAVYASSSESSYTAAEYAVDNNLTSRWSSKWAGDEQWIYVDLGKRTQVTGVTLYWEGAHATKYRIQLSDDEMTWTDAHQVTNSDGGTDTIALSGEARYVRLFCEEKAIPAYGYSLFEMEVYGLNGMNKPIPNYGTNIALNKEVSASSISTIWWLIAYYPPGAADAANVNDGDKTKLWRSDEQEKDQWITIDLGRNYEIGRVVLDWNNDGAGKYYDIQISADNKNFTTLYRETKGNGGTKDVPVYGNARYVRMYGYGKHATGNGFWLNEFEIYEYKDGDEKKNHTIPPLPAAEVVTVGSGSYLANKVSMPQPRLPLYKDDSIKAPIESNDWWQSLLISKLGNTLSTLPLKVKYSKQGLGILTAGAGWLNDRSVVTEESIDFYLMPEGLNAAGLHNKVVGYGDYSVKAALLDEEKAGMESTIIKGSPYIFHEFKNTREAQIYSNTITDIFNGDNKSILQNSGESVVTDHIGIEITDSDNKEGSVSSKSFYSINVPEGTRFQKVGSKIRIIFTDDKGYMSVASMTKRDQLEFFYRHGYAFVTDTHVNYTYQEDSSKVIINYTVDTELKRNGFTNQTVQCLLPHQWKKSNALLTELVYPSVRGNLKLCEGNSFTTNDTFYGMVPQFTLPSNAEYSELLMEQYLENLNTATKDNLKSADAYWQGKSLHPLAMGLLAADQMGEGEYMGKFISRLKVILEDWLTYSGEEDEFFLYYDPEWGTLYYRISEFGANIGITDHHFTYGYLVFAATVLASYDNEFYEKYKDMIEHMVRDYANPSDKDPLYPRFRNYDLYEGHSWAGGYADNDSGNNQEAAGESLFGWVGEYLWGVKTGNKAYRDAGIFGFTTELSAVEQYWFNFDKDNWIEDWKHASVGQVYGSTNFFGTFFHGDPVYVYGIHWLPTSEYLTSYGFNKAAAADLYQGLVDDVNEERAKRPNDKVDGPDDVWQHIAWPIQALSDPAAVLAKWDGSKTQFNETFNTYWFINNMADLGGRTQKVWAAGGASATVYEKNGVYQALAWNPTNAPITIQFRNSAGVVGSVTVKEKALVRIDPFKHHEGIVGNSTEPKEEEPEKVPVIEGTNVAVGKEVTASSEENAGTSAMNAADGNEDTRWSSNHNDNEWISVDLGKAYELSGVILKWEASYALKYEIQVSNDGQNYTTAAVKNNGKGGSEAFELESIRARYVKIQGIERALPYGYSLWELEVYSKDDGGANTDSELLSSKKEVTASSEENVGTVASHVVDGNPETRWSSAFTDDEWIAVDLGAIYKVDKISLNWETSCAASYELLVSKDGNNYQTVFQTTEGKPGIKTVAITPVEARFVKMQGITRALPYGYSLYEFEVYGKR